MLRRAVFALLALPMASAFAGNERPITHVETLREAAVPAAPADCTWESVARKWNVNPYMLYAIAKTESNLNPKAVNRSNSNGSEDVGMMQINSFWFPKLAKHGITREHLFDACVSLDVAGWILSQNMGRHGNTWTAVGAYNAVSPEKRVAYARKVLKNLPSQAFSNGSESP